MTVMIDFFESKTFNAASVGALTMAVSYCSDMSTWATIGLTLLAAGAFLLIFRKGRIELQMHQRGPTTAPTLASVAAICGTVQDRTTPIGAYFQSIG